MASSLLLKSLICGLPLGGILFSEIRRVKKIREDERLNKSLFLKNFNRNNIITKKKEEGNNFIVYTGEKHNFNHNTQGMEGKKKVKEKEQVEMEVEDGELEEVLNYFYGKAWGYTTDYEIDISLNTGDLIFIKHDLYNINFFKRIMLKINRYFQNGNSDYDEIGIILKKYNISYVYIQNVINRKDKLIRYSYFLQKYKPSVVSLRRFISDDENIKIELKKNIEESLISIDKEINDHSNFSIFFVDLLYNAFKQTVHQIINKMYHSKGNLYNDYNNRMYNKISSNIDINNLINMLLFRSFNLFFYFITYISEKSCNIDLSNNDKRILLKNVEETKKYIGATLSKDSLLNYEFPINSFTCFPFIEKDYNLIKDKNNFIYQKLNGQVQKEVENFVSLMVENEHTLTDSIEYMNNAKKKEEKNRQGKRGEMESTSSYISYSNYFSKKINFFFEKLFLKLKNYTIRTNDHVYDIYKKTHLLPSIKNYNSSLSLFLCLNNFYKPLNTQNVLGDKFSIPKLSNLFHVRQEETEKRQKYFYQFNKVPKA
ncbi:hypothetical protein MKS88_002813 [Plasmodium brasilianum]|uniref:Uncharacterized protein n=2 Tax=Plasmodium (Plasmodium) TaxID=418103 RepID=A0A1A8VY97_PLAMA|nr:conserved Plasmodium protein, unknown function [Plasmodium malariae]KAI4838336.1 hypothetical protein MKS88_002813 [Plasmodium brasilianum]SBS85476.1 conserved Plasmodium protein, unknown function [Plasmodium malariae]SCN12734.1 conserved Plasmodium protein, unknown function [Plasmodium malariae]